MKFKYLILGLIGLATIAFAQQGPSIRQDGDIAQYSIPVSTGDRSVIGSSMTFSNDTLSVSNLVVLYTAQFPSPAYINSIYSDDFTISNSLTIAGTRITNITQTVTASSNEAPTCAAVSNALSGKVSVTNGNAITLTANDRLVQSDCTVSGSLAVSNGFDGVYSYLYTDPIYGPIFSNGTAIMYYGNPIWYLCSILGVPLYVNFSYGIGQWLDVGYSPVEIYGDTAPIYKAIPALTLPPSGFYIIDNAFGTPIKVQVEGGSWKLTPIY